MHHSRIAQYLSQPEVSNAAGVQQICFKIINHHIYKWNNRHCNVSIDFSLNQLHDCVK